IIDTARSVGFRFPDKVMKDPVTGKDILVPEYNHEFWDSIVLLKALPASSGIADMFGDNKADYAMGCQLASLYIHLRAAFLTIGAEVDQWLSTKPIVTLHNTSLERYVLDDYDWIPGDQGYIINQDPNPEPGYEGEHVTYLGGLSGKGCFQKGLEFENEARFWGHLTQTNLRERTYWQWWATVDSWDPLTEPLLKKTRRYLRQPLGAPIPE
ncbi:MAG TPA: hypothetical protein VFI02_17320, partial [Armatimonadota bacterium]|nr:hypothetical protein [Armatimonadota bacterium]